MCPKACHGPGPDSGDQQNLPLPFPAPVLPYIYRTGHTPYYGFPSSLPTNPTPFFSSRSSSKPCATPYHPRKFWISVTDGRDTRVLPATQLLLCQLPTDYYAIPYIYIQTHYAMPFPFQQCETCVCVDRQGQTGRQTTAQPVAVLPCPSPREPFPDVRWWWFFSPFLPMPAHLPRHGTPTLCSFESIFTTTPHTFHTVLWTGGGGRREGGGGEGGGGRAGLAGGLAGWPAMEGRGKGSPTKKRSQ